MYRGLKETKWSCNFSHKTTGSAGRGYTYLIHGYSIANAAKYFVEDGLQSY